MYELDDEFSPLGLAIRDTVLNFVHPISKQKGATGLASLVAMNPRTLSNKANPKQDHQLGLEESVPIQIVSKNYAILYTYSRVLGHVAYQLPDPGCIGDVELLTVYCQLHADVGLMASRIRAALQDGRITHHEAASIREAFDHLARAGLGVVSRIEALAR